MDQWMAKPGSETGEHGIGVRLISLASLKQKSGSNLLPVIVVIDKLVLEEVDPSSLILALAKEFTIVVQCNLARRVLPWLVPFATGMFVDVSQMVS